jgi:FkbM family methyltransferase
MSVFRVLLWPFRHYGRPAASPAVPTALPALTLEQYERLAPAQKLREGDIDVIYATPNTATKWRVDSLFTKEPDTIEWIRGFRPGEILVDIGANVGMYTIWAAKTRGVRVYAFEPESQNYALLYKNIVLNDLVQQVVAYCVALSDETGYSLLHLSEFHPGGSCHTFGEKVDYKLERRESKVSQGCVSATLDQLIESGVVAPPDYIKIDVDGFEHKVLAGCRNVLANPRLKSILVEINTNLEQHRRIITDLQELGFTYSEQQAATALRTEGAFKGVGNHVFRR